MAIHTFLNNESGSTILGNLNDNFDELETQKIEADSTATLTNKTIDAEGTGNSITNLKTSNVKTSSKSGVDAVFITGTEGTSDNLAKWNTDGDLVDAGVSIGSGSMGTSATVVPTEDMIANYVTSAIPTSTTAILYPVYTFRTAQEFAFNQITGDTASARNNVSGHYVGFQPWYVPSNYGTITSVELVYMATGTTPASVTIGYDCTQPGQLPGTGAAAGQTSSAFNLAYTTATLNVNDIYTQAGGSSFWATIASTDYVGFRFTLATAATDDLGIMMLKVHYTITS